MTVVEPDPVVRLREQMRERHLTPLWELEGEIMGVRPNPSTRPWLWRWSDLYAVAKRAGELVPIERGGDRRAIALSNPGQGGMPYATSTLWAAVQWLNGGEVAPAHRHTSQAIRFIIDGAGSYSTVEGDRVYLERGDLVLPHPDDSQKVTAAPNSSVLKYGVGQLRPAWESRSLTQSPLQTYKWSDTRRALDNLATVDADPFDDVALEYTNPHTGGPVMATFTCWMQMLRPGVHTRAHRHTGSSVYLAFEGSGATIIDGIRFSWTAGDMLVIPSWATHEHLSDEAGPALLFSVHDTPLLKALDKYRHEPHDSPDGRQRVTGEF
jgi:gentisate 1,2-dioxygenase